jgi:hypothetical protein
MEVYFLAPLFDFCGPADSGGCKEYPYFGQINFTLQHPEWMPIDRYGVRRQNGPIELCYPREGMENFCMVPNQADQDEKLYRNFPTPLAVFRERPLTPPPYDPTAK